MPPAAGLLAASVTLLTFPRRFAAGSSSAAMPPLLPPSPSRWTEAPLSPSGLDASRCGGATSSFDTIVS